MSNPIADGLRAAADGCHPLQQALKTRLSLAADLLDAQDEELSLMRGDVPELLKRGHLRVLEGLHERSLEGSDGHKALSWALPKLRALP